MTIGDKIKYYRKKYNITSNQLSQLTGITDSNIRKIETNKTSVTDENAKKIAVAFGVSTLAITGKISTFTLETVGDLLGIIIFLIKNNILCISGDRNIDDRLYTDTAYIQFSPLFDTIFSAKIHDEVEKITAIMLQFKRENHFEKLLEWEYFIYTLNKLDKTNDTIDDNEIENVRMKVQAAIECLELDMQSIPYLLNNDDNKISIRNPQIINLNRNKSFNLVEEAYLMIERIKQSKK